MLEQLTLNFEENMALNIGDRAQIILPDPVRESESYFYLKYYYPNIINKVGKIIDKELNRVGHPIYKICIDGEILTLSDVELRSSIWSCSFYLLKFHQNIYYIWRALNDTANLILILVKEKSENLAVITVKIVIFIIFF